MLHASPNGRFNGGTRAQRSPNGHPAANVSQHGSFGPSTVLEIQKSEMQKRNDDFENQPREETRAVGCLPLRQCKEVYD